MRAEQLVDMAPWFAEAWNQRAIALYGLGRYLQSIDDCRQALEINPYHFGAAAGMGQCHLHRGDMDQALSCAPLVEEMSRGPGRTGGRGLSTPAQERAVDVQITRLRRKIEPDPRQPRYLQTVRGSGYRLQPD